MPHVVNIAHNKHYAKWMGNAPILHPAEQCPKKFFRAAAVFLGVQSCFVAYVGYYFEKRTITCSMTRPEWHSSFVSDLEFNPPLWRHEIPGSIPYIRTVSIEDTWERVQNVREKHWTEDYEYTKPWEVDDGQWGKNKARYW
mmetsp:Transcript_30731/g.37707  ORF Transcript_30731/g.37707 Transcript_30731/m.37707 type:complete len:141 (-) Transcript_30731:69-491(-)